MGERGRGRGAKARLIGGWNREGIEERLRSAGKNWRECGKMMEYMAGGRGNRRDVVTGRIRRGCGDMLEG